MTAERKEELLVKIEKVASNEIEEFTVMDSDIKIVNSLDENQIVIDMIVMFMKNDEEAPDR